MQTHSDIVKAAGSAEEVALARGVSVHTVRSWILRNSIPAEHWAGFVADGKATLEGLAEFAAAKRSVPTTPALDHEETPNEQEAA